MTEASDVISAIVQLVIFGVTVVALGVTLGWIIWAVRALYREWTQYHDRPYL